jgi:hypothetical protein
VDRHKPRDPFDATFNGPSAKIIHGSVSGWALLSASTYPSGSCPGRWSSSQPTGDRICHVSPE